MDEDDQRWRDPHPQQVPVAPPPSAADRAPQGGPRAGDRHEGHRTRAAQPRPRHRAGEPVHRRPGPARLGGRGRRRVRAVPADPDARLQHRRRRGRGDLAGRQPVLPGAVGRGARPGGAVPGADDAAVRDRGAADRAVPRPVRARPALGDRRDDGGPRVPLLGAGLVGQQRLGAGLRRRARRARLVQGVRRHAGRRRAPPPPARLHAGQGQRPGLALRHRRCRRSPRRSPRWPRSRGRSGRCATRSCCS